MLHARMRTRRRAFTLIELIVVVVIIAVLAAIAAVAYNQFAAKARANAVLATASELRTAVMAASARDDQAPAAEVDTLWNGAGGNTAAFLTALSTDYTGPLTYTPTGATSPATLQVGSISGSGHAACLTLPDTVSEPVTLAPNACPAPAPSTTTEPVTDLSPTADPSPSLTPTPSGTTSTSADPTPSTSSSTSTSAAPAPSSTSSSTAASTDGPPPIGDPNPPQLCTTAPSPMPGCVITAGTASASRTGIAGAPSAGIDENLATQWNAGQTTGSWQETWGTAFSFSAVSVYHGTTAGTRTYVVTAQTADGSWVQIGSASIAQNGAGTATVAVTPGQYTGLKIAMSSSNLFAGVFEVSVTPTS